MRLPPMHCPECGCYGNEEDLCEVGQECPNEECDGIIEFVGTPMTVSAIIHALSEWPSDMVVLMDDGKGWWRTVSRIVGPHWNTRNAVAGWSDEDTGYQQPTLKHGGIWDCRFTPDRIKEGT